MLKKYTRALMWLLRGQSTFAVVRRIVTLQNEISLLRAQLYVAKDAQLRNYDGLAQKADRVDVLEVKYAAAVAEIAAMKATK